MGESLRQNSAEFFLGNLNIRLKFSRKEVSCCFRVSLIMKIAQNSDLAMFFSKGFQNVPCSMFHTDNLNLVTQLNKDS